MSAVLGGLEGEGGRWSEGASWLAAAAWPGRSLDRRGARPALLLRARPSSCASELRSSSGPQRQQQHADMLDEEAARCWMCEHFAASRRTLRKGPCSCLVDALVPASRAERAAQVLARPAQPETSSTARSVNRSRLLALEPSPASCLPLQQLSGVVARVRRVPHVLGPTCLPALADRRTSIDLLGSSVPPSALLGQLVCLPRPHQLMNLRPLLASSRRLRPFSPSTPTSPARRRLPPRRARSTCPCG